MGIFFSLEVVQEAAQPFDPAGKIGLEVRVYNLLTLI
jgi:hypothetical protein